MSTLSITSAGNDRAGSGTVQVPAGTWALRRADVVCLVALAVGVIASRLPYLVADTMLSKDGPLYVHSLDLGPSYSVPMPGNIGFVLLGKLATWLWPDPVAAFAAVNILLSFLGAAGVYLLARRAWPVGLSAATAAALLCSPTVWWHGTTINSYLAWLAILPAVGLFGLRYLDARRPDDLFAAAVVLGLGTILRQDLLAFGGPLLLGILVLGRAPLRGWLLCGAVLALCAAAWFLATSAVLGGTDVYLERVRQKHDWHMESFSFRHRGWFEGLARNGVKYAMFLAWAAPLVVLPFVVGAGSALRVARAHWRLLVLAALWVAPSWYFSVFVFAGNAGLIFPFLPLLYLGAAWGCARGLGRLGRAAPTAAMASLALLSLAQFTLTPILPQTDQRRAILNVTFLHFSGHGLLQAYHQDLNDLGIDPSLDSILEQLRDPQPMPAPPDRTALARPATPDDGGTPR